MTSPEQHRARAAIRPVKQAVEDELLARDGVVAVDIGEKVTGGDPTGEMAIVVYVEKKQPADRLAEGAAIPAEINGVKTDVQEMKVVLQAPTARARVEDVGAEVDAGKYSTLTGGISIGPARSVYLSPPDVPSAGYYIFAGTLGAMVRDRSTGSTMALTNFHVACVDSTWHVGDRMVQPSRLDGGQTPADQFGSLARATLSDAVDGAVVTLDASDQWSPTIQDIGGVAGHVAASVGQAVQKRGRTTEHTYGTVASTDFSVTIDYGDGLGTRTLHNQIRITPDTTHNPRFSDHGDSGSVVVDGNRNVVGLLFAGSDDGSATFANPIQNVLDELNVDLIVQLAVITRPVVCVVTRAVSCVFTRPALCTLPTRSAISCLFTRPSVCTVLVTRDCPIDPGGPVENPVLPGLPGPVQSAADEVSQDFLAGYLTALEVVASEQERDGAGR